MDKDKIIALIEHYKDRYNSPIIEANGFTRIVPKIVNTATCYVNSKYASKSNKKRKFYNVTKPVCDTYWKNIDLDTKDIFFKAKRPEDRIKAYFINRKLEQYNSDFNVGYTVNKAEQDYVIYGNVVIRTIPGQPIEVVNLKNFYYDVHAVQKASTYEMQGDYAILVTPHTINEIEEHDEWDNINKIKSAYNKINADEIVYPEINILDCVMLAPNKLFDGQKGYSYYHCVVALDDRFDLKEILYYKKVKSIGDYYMLYSGTSSGSANFKVGIAEMIFEDQKEINFAVTALANSVDIAQLNIFQSLDPTIMKNILSEAQNGDVFNMDIRHVDTAVINPTQFTLYKELFEDVIRRKTNAFEILTGENLPSNQTLGGAVLQSQAGGKLFEIERENWGLFLDELYTKHIVPSFMKTLKEEDVIDILDDKSLEEIWDVSAKNKVTKDVLKKIMEGAEIPTREDIDIMLELQREEERKNNLWNVTKEYLTDFDKTLYIDTSGEKHNLQQKVSVMSQVLLNSNILAVLTNPVTAKAGEALLEMVGFDKNLIDTTAAQNQMIQPQAEGQQQTTSQSGIENIANQFTKEGEVK